MRLVQKNFCGVVRKANSTTQESVVDSTARQLNSCGRSLARTSDSGDDHWFNRTYARHIHQRCAMFPDTGARAKEVEALIAYRGVSITDGGRTGAARKHDREPRVAAASTGRPNVSRKFTATVVCCGGSQIAEFSKPCLDPGHARGNILRRGTSRDRTHFRALMGSVAW